ncbi:hypothetical protein PV10_03146 [Exophiala mesophila]|uniref:Uncharacterized protein n=1 Tax=Exophiala mesophila TaxID=212818 RepID=A0A0D1ZLP2_EXOME|nr:uncharacterized protein PV10_03146 [Exophiala mesophila]KIV95497.1 hypothetical protein PV10_03146 [Exophiala mesophila]
MENICVRCSRLGLTAGRARHAHALAVTSRTFSSARTLQAENDSNDKGPTIRRTPTGPEDSVETRRIQTTRPNNNNSRGSPRPGPQRQFNPQRPAPTGPSSTSSQSPSSSSSTSSPGGGPTILRRSGPGTGRLQPINLTGGRGGGFGGPPGRGGGFRGPPGRGGGFGRGRGGAARPGDSRIHRARAKAARDQAQQEQDDGSTDAAFDEYVRTNLDPPVNPTEEIDHVPGKNMSLEELRKEWPNTPLTSVGLVESVQQRIEFLSHRLQHDYQTPMQLVERYQKGKFVRFESEEEKETVIKLATELAQQKADEAKATKGEDVPVEDMSFSNVAERADERKGLTEAYVKGKYPEPVKQKMPFMDDIAQALINNPTYNTLQAEEFLKSIETAVSAHRGGARQKSA